MSFAHLVAEMTGVLAEQLYEDALYTVPGQSPVPVKAAIDEPVADAISGYPRHALRERRTEVWLLKAEVPTAVRGARLEVLLPSGTRGFTIDSQAHADPDRIKVSCDEVSL